MAPLAQASTAPTRGSLPHPGAALPPGGGSHRCTAPASPRRCEGPHGDRWSGTPLAHSVARGLPTTVAAVSDGLGFTIATSQSIWPDHPEKVLASTRAWTLQNPDAARALVMTLLEAARCAHDPAHHEEVAHLLVNCGYVQIRVAQILPRLRGRYHDGLGNRWQDAHSVRFHAHDEASYP